MADLDWNTIIATTSERYETGIARMQDMTGWEKCGTGSDDVTCFKKFDEASNFALFKAEMYVDKPAELVGRHFYDNWGAINVELQPDDFVDGGELGKQSDDVKVRKFQISAKTAVSAREFHHSWIWLPLGNGTFAIAAYSCDTGVAPDADHVLGDANYIVMLFEPAAGDVNRTHFTSISHIDPKGSVPAVIVNAILDRRAAFYVSLREKAQAL